MRDAPWTRCRAATHDDNDYELRASGAYRNPRGGRHLLVVYWHLFSLLGCCAAVGLAAKSAVLTPDEMVLWVEHGNRSLEEHSPPSASSLRVNPLTRHARQLKQNS
uniref:Transmembrane protein n=1 Tax=Steinernema glaseri TaxID=37863 RepID=A0A1I7Z495_9BILA